MTIGQRIRLAREAAGLTQEAVAAHFGISKPAVTQWETGANGPARKRLEDLAKVLGVSADWLLTGAGSGPAVAVMRPNVRPAKDQQPPATGTWPRDVPVLGTAVGGADDHFDLNGEVVDYVRRPPHLAGLKTLFALYVVGNSMSPAYEEGDIIYLQAGRQPALGDYVVVEMKPRDGDGEVRRAYLKRLVRRAGNTLVLEQFTPKMELPIPQAHVHALYRVLRPNELLGT